MDALTEDVTQMSDTQLAQTATDAQAELARRATLRDHERTTDDMALAYLEAAGRENGAAWEPPTGFIGAYPRGWRVTHGGGTFEATAPGVVTTPPGDGWDQVAPDTPLIPFWEPGTYAKGTQVRDAGQVWRALADGADGSRPSEFPGGWSPVA